MSSGLKIVLSALGILVFFIGVGMCSRPEAPETIPMSDSQKAASARHQGTASKPANNEPVRADVEIIDCLAVDAPDWCSKISYGTDSERTGTLVAVVRSDAEGKIHWCSAGRREDGSRVYLGEATSYGFDEQTVRDMGARLVTLVPRRGDQSDVYFVLSQGASAPESMGRCPLAE